MRATISRHYHLLDAVRGLAAIAVMVYHLKDLFGGVPLLAGSFLAVDLFFLMSGLVIAKAYDRKIIDGSMSVGRFIWIRVLRLYPLYIAASIIGASYFILKIALDVADAPSNSEFISALPGAFFLIPTFGASSWGFAAFPFALSSWSLSFEFWFNIAYVLIALRLDLRSLTVIAIAAFCVACQQAWVNETLDLGWSEENLIGGAARFWFSFTVGVIIYRAKLIYAAPPKFAVLLLPIVFGFVAVPHSAIGLQLFWIAIAFPTLIMLVSNTPVHGIACKVCDHLGRLSYGIYILHASIVLMTLGISKQLIGPDWMRYDAAIGASIIAVVLIASAVLTYFYDEPLRARFRTASRQTITIRKIV